jgi:hypothetical protein
VYLLCGAFVLGAFVVLVPLSFLFVIMFYIRS